MDKQKIAIVIPAYDVADQIEEVVLSVHAYDFVDYIIVVDDQCPHSSGRIAEGMQLNNLIVLYHEKNLGVGGAVITGYQKAMDLDCDIIIKIDGDGQMDARHLSKLIKPLIDGDADYTKGNRFRDFKALKAMPAIRLIGNSLLSFFVKSASGYWNIMDPTNGYTAMHKGVLQRLNLDKISHRYFFESDILIHLNILNAVVKDIDIPSKYGQEKSSLRIMNVLVNFPPKLLKGFVKRIFFKYFLYDFNMASVYILIGLPIFFMSSIFGIYEWIDSFITGTSKTAGTIMLVALPIIVSFQMLMQAIQIDINSVPKKDS